MKNGDKKYNESKAIKTARRIIAVEHGVYDGRFSPKVIPNKKKQQSKKSCRDFRKGGLDV